MGDGRRQTIDGRREVFYEFGLFAVCLSYCIAEKDVAVMTSEMTSETMGPSASVLALAATQSGSARKASQALFIASTLSNLQM